MVTARPPRPAKPLRCFGDSAVPLAAASLCSEGRLYTMFQALMERHSRIRNSPLAQQGEHNQYKGQVVVQVGQNETPDGSMWGRHSSFLVERCRTPKSH